jgi:excisionase family DNA binding protein
MQIYPTSSPDTGMVSTRDAADSLGVTTQYVGRLIRAGELAAVNVALGADRPRYRIPSDSLARFKDERRTRGC